MDLSKLTPKDKELYEIAMERKSEMFKEFKKNVTDIEYEALEEIIHHISRAEYKRGKADGSRWCARSFEKEQGLDD